MTRKPSSLISCSQSPPEGGSAALVGRHGATKPAGRTLLNTAGLNKTAGAIRTRGRAGGGKQEIKTRTAAPKDGQGKAVRNGERRLEGHLQRGDYARSSAAASPSRTTNLLIARDAATHRHGRTSPYASTRSLRAPSCRRAGTRYRRRRIGCDR